MRELQSSESAAIVYLRSIAMISIVVGHLFQSLESSLIYVLYAISYMYPTIKKRTKLILCVVCFLAVIFIIASSNSLPNPNSIEHLVAHMLGGILIVGALISVFDTFKIESYPLALKVTDRYSYYVYLTHYVFLFGPLALIVLTNIILLNIMFVILAAVVSSVLLYRLHNLILRVKILNKKSFTTNKGIGYSV